MRFQNVNCWPSVRRTERVVVVENLLRRGVTLMPAWSTRAAVEPRRLRPARRVLQPADRRLRGQRCAAVRAAADCELHEQIVPQPVKVDGILEAADNRG